MGNKYEIIEGQIIYLLIDAGEEEKFNNIFWGLKSGNNSCITARIKSAEVWKNTVKCEILWRNAHFMRSDIGLIKNWVVQVHFGWQWKDNYNVVFFRIFMNKEELDREKENWIVNTEWKIKKTVKEILN